MPLLFIIMPYFTSVFLFIRQVHLDKRRFLKKHRQDNNHILKDVARFLAERQLRQSN
jgi:hypothetical protein